MTNTHACETHTSENKGKTKQNERHTHTEEHKSWKLETNYVEISTICHKLRQQGTKSQPVSTANVQ